MVLDSQKTVVPDSHGTVKNYSNNFKDNIWTVTFDSMDSTCFLPLEINSQDTLKFNSAVKDGDVWLKITQGDLAKSEIQKIQSINGENLVVDLSKWDSGEVMLWLVVDNGKNGVITIEHVKND